MNLSELLYEPLPSIPEGPIDDDFGLFFERSTWIDTLEDQEKALEDGDSKYEDEKLKSLALIRGKIDEVERQMDEIERKVRSQDGLTLAGEAETATPIVSDDQLKVRQQIKRKTDGQLLIWAVLDKFESKYRRTPSCTEAWACLLCQDFSDELIRKKTSKVIHLYEGKIIDRSGFRKRYNAIYDPIEK